MNDATNTERNLALLARAWDLVSPAIRYGLSWKAPVVAILSVADLAAAGVTIENVKDAVVFYTATEARVSSEKIATSGSLVDGFLVMAPGYAAGPAA